MHLDAYKLKIGSNILLKKKNKFNRIQSNDE